MRSLRTTVTTLAVSAVVGLGGIVAPIAANASRDGNRNGAIILGAAALVLALSQNNHRSSRYRDDYAEVRYRRDDNCDRDGRRYESTSYRDDNCDRDSYRYQSTRYRDDYGDGYRGDRPVRVYADSRDSYDSRRYSDDDCQDDRRGAYYSTSNRDRGYRGR